MVKSSVRLLVFLVLIQTVSSKSFFRGRKHTKASLVKSTATPMDAQAASLMSLTSETPSLRVAYKPQRQIVLWAIPILTTAAAFLLFQDMTHGFHHWMQILSHNTWTPPTAEEIDLQTQVVTQVVNGPVITSVSVLFATLVSTTVSSLHGRQVAIRSAYVEQLDAIRHLRLLLTNLSPKLGQELEPHLQNYTRSVLQDDWDTRRTMEPSLRCMMLALQETLDNAPNSPLLLQAYQVVLLMNQIRCQRWKALQTTFPAMHYAALALLATTICIAFLVATDQSTLIFESLQVRILWCILVGAFTSLAVVCFDLSSPFLGAYHTATVSDDELRILKIKTE